MVRAPEVFETAPGDSVPLEEKACYQGWDGANKPDNSFHVSNRKW